jgi:hypothetical protein
MSSARNFGYSIIEAGPGCIIAKPDIVDAYKNVPAKIKDLQYQGFYWLGKYFIELRQMFGAKGAVQNFDILSNTVKTLALAKSRIPSKFVHRQLDDVPIVGPRNSGWCEEFLSTYKKICSDINLVLAEECQSFDKAFGCTTSGKVLGIYFNTIDQTWKLPEDKKLKTIDSIFDTSEVSMLQMQSLSGRLSFASSMCPFMNCFKFNVNSVLSSAINNGKAHVTHLIKDDLRIWKNFLTSKEWLPIPHEKYDPPLACLNFWSDAAGFPDNGIWTSDIGCGIYGSDIDGNTILGFQIWWPKPFITTAMDNKGKRFGNKTTTLEMIAILIPFLTVPEKLGNCHIRKHTDNMACVFGCKDGYVKNDEYASILIRALYIISAFLGSAIHVEHCPRRSSWEAATADNFTRLKTTTFLENQILSRFLHLQIPSPLSSWLVNPSNDWQLPLSLLEHCMNQVSTNSN